MATVNELIEQRAALMKEARDILERAEREKRAPTAEERSRWEVINQEVDRLKREIDQMEFAAMRQKTAADMAELESRRVIAPLPDPPPMSADAKLLAEARTRFNDFASADETERWCLQRRNTEEYLRDFRRYLDRGEQRSLVAGQDVKGGFLVPMTFMSQLIQELDDLLFFRQYAKTIAVTGSASLGCPTLTEDLDDAEWTQEIPTAISQDEMAFGKREWRPQPLAKAVSASRKLIRSSVVPIEQFVASRMAAVFARTLEKAYMVGNGAGQPLGVFTASADGISTARDVATASQTALSGDDLLDLVGAVKQQYRRNAVFVMHRNTVTAARKLKDTQGQYLWQQGLAAGQPDRLLGYPVLESEFAPGAWAAGKYVAVFGDLSYYWIADSLQFEIITDLSEIKYNRLVWYGFAESDGMPVLENAFARLQVKP